MKECCSISKLAGVFAALSDGTRLRLLNLLNGREVCVCHFAEVLGQSQPKISRHLAYLRRAGLVEARRAGKWMHYRIAADAGTGGVLAETLDALGRDEQMQADVARLEQTCCAPAGLTTIGVGTGLSGCGTRAGS